MKRFLNFNYAEIFFISFCSFWSFGVYGPSSFMVDDYTAERERERERERGREREGERGGERVGGREREMFFPITKIFKNNTERRSIV